MGRLYWKFFAFFFFAQFTTLLIVTFVIGVLQHPVDFGLQPIGAFKPIPLDRARDLFPLIPLVVGVFVSFIFAALLASYFSKPIRLLRQAFERAASGDLQVCVGSTMQGRRDELTDLGNAFDVMVSRISQVLQSQTTLLHQVSHELRSPLSRLQMAIGLLKLQPDKLEVSLDRIERESVRMDSLVGELLTLSRLESGVMTLQKEPIDLYEMLLELLTDARFEGKAKHINIQFMLETKLPILVLGQQDLLYCAIENVLRNAIKYSPQGSVVSAKLSKDVTSNQAFVQIRDHGAGVSDADLMRIFTPFYRAESDSNPANQGYGLGLAIAKQIVESHGGQIEAKKPSDGGFMLEMRLPSYMP